MGKNRRKVLDSSLTVRIENDDIVKLEGYAKDDLVSMGVLVRRAVKEYLKRRGEDRFRSDGRKTMDDAWRGGGKAGGLAGGFDSRGQELF